MCEIQRLIDDFRAHRWSSNPYELTCRLLDGPDDRVVTLVEMVLQQLPTSGTFFADAISFVPEQELPRLATLALTMLRKGGPHETAEEFLKHCSLQRVDALHPHLSEIWELKPNWEGYYSDWPWRGSGLLHFDFLREATKDSPEAWNCLLETRHPSILDYCMESDRVGASDFLAVGFETEAGARRQLFASDVWHLVFPDDYWYENEPPIHMVKRHPTWSCAEGQRISFGGRGVHLCAACGGPGHRLFSLGEIPPELPVTQLGQLHLETCLSCLGWEVPCLFYHHDSEGNVSPVGYAGKRVVPQFPQQPLKEIEVRLARTPPRWQWQDWAVANGRQNLHRVGGHPCWIQDAQYLTCPLCQRTMGFLFQLESDLPVEPAGEFLWGSGGIGYGNWCDRCKVSGYLWQCT